MKDSLKDAILERRSIRVLKKDDRLDENYIRKILSTCMYAPSPFNMQSARTVVLIGKSHDDFWNIVKDTLREIVPQEKFSSTENKLNGFMGGNGTLLFFNDDAIVNSFKDKFKLYADMFEIWAEHAAAILQYACWLRFYDDRIGASLQHYNPIIDNKVKERFEIDDSWRLIAQMPFGAPNEKPGEKELLPFDDQFIFKN